MTSNMHYYAAHSYMGLNYTYDSPCWSLYVFDSKKERDDWVNENEYSQDTGNYVAMAVDKKTAIKLCPWLRTNSPDDPQNGYYNYNSGREVIHL